MCPAVGDLGFEISTFEIGFDLRKTRKAAPPRAYIGLHAHLFALQPSVILIGLIDLRIRRIQEKLPEHEERARAVCLCSCSLPCLCVGIAG